VATLGKKVNAFRMLIMKPPARPSRKFEDNVYINLCSCEIEGSKNLKIKMYKTVILPVVLYGCET